MYIYIYILCVCVCAYVGLIAALHLRPAPFERAPRLCVRESE